MALFDILWDVPVASGELVYSRRDLAFDTTPSGVGGRILTINELQLVLADDDGTVTGLWGYCPYHSWQEKSLRIPVATDGRLRVRSVETLQRGVAVDVDDSATRWPVHVDYATRVLCFGATETGDTPGIRFLPGAIAFVVRGRLLSLWLTPITFDADS